VACLTCLKIRLFCYSSLRPLEYEQKHLIREFCRLFETESVGRIIELKDSKSISKCSPAVSTQESRSHHEQCMQGKAVQLAGTIAKRFVPVDAFLLLRYGDVPIDNIFDYGCELESSMAALVTPRPIITSRRTAAACLQASLRITSQDTYTSLLSTRLISAMSVAHVSKGCRWLAFSREMPLPIFKTYDVGIWIFDPTWPAPKRLARTINTHPTISSPSACLMCSSYPCTLPALTPKYSSDYRQPCTSARCWSSYARAARASWLRSVSHSALS
jgi:hypothetical protein